MVGFGFDVVSALSLAVQRIFVASLLLWAAFCWANYSLGLGFFGRRTAKLLLALTIGVLIVWGTRFAPTREELDKDDEARKARKGK